MPLIPILIWGTVAMGVGGLSGAALFNKADDALDGLIPVAAIGGMGLIAYMAVKASKK